MSNRKAFIIVLLAASLSLVWSGLAAQAKTPVKGKTQAAAAPLALGDVAGN